jgi:hypothetical protein
LVSARIWRKYRVPLAVALKVLEHLAARTPFAQIHAEVGVDMAVISLMYRSGWQSELVEIRVEFGQGNDQPPSESVAGRNSSQATATYRARPSTKTIADVRDLLHLGIAREDVRIYLQLDRENFTAALNRIYLMGVEGS